MKARLLTYAPVLFFAYFLLGTAQVSAQTVALNAPKPAGNPNSGGTPTVGAWPKICAGNNNGFNQYFATVTWAGTPNSDNVWILELSDASGSFANATELAREASNATVQNPGFEFSIPTNTRGAGYKLRVRGTSPATTGPATADSYSMYYMDVTTPLAISKDGDGEITSNICSNTSSVRLEVHNIPDPETYQYNWYRSGTLLPTKTYFINASSDGMYQVQVDYGECSGNGTTESNAPMVTLNATGQGIAINTPSKTGICAGETETLTIDTTNSGWNYQWYKNDTAIPGAIASSFTVNGSAANFDGDYQVEISGSGICTERSAPVTMTNAGEFTVTRNNNANVVLLPSETETLSVTTDAVSPTYEWFRNGSAIADSDSSSLDVTTAGTYYVSITSGGSCSSTINSETTEVVSPAAFRFEIDYATAYESCVSSSIVLEVSKIFAELSDGNEIDVTTDVAGNFAYQWTKDGIDIAGETSQSISLTSNTENGNYTVVGVSGSFNASSNTLPVQLGTSGSLSISSTSTVYCSASDIITISTDTNLIGETFTWQKDGASFNTSDTELIVTEPGTYRLTIAKGECPLVSNEITIAPLDEDLITLDIDGDVIFPEGSSKTVNANGGTAYRWFDANNVEIATGPSITFTEEGSYLLVANVDNCEISKTIRASFLDLFNIPNVITPNGDGSNDQWVIPNSYSNKSDVRVIIYNAKGVEVLNATNYQNSWPESSTSFTQQNMVFYYVIKNASETLKQGTITVIR